MDEHEHGERRLLNLGHTPAHAIERLSGYTILHGVAVSMGLGLILKASKNLGYITDSQLLDMQGVIEKLVGKVSCPYTIEQIIDNTLTDKKREGKDINLVLVRGVGDCFIQKMPFNGLIDCFL